MSEAEQQRYIQQIHARLAISPFTAEQGLELLDVARASERSLLLPVRLDITALRARATGGTLPTILSTLIRRPAQGRKATGVVLATRLAQAPESEYDAIVLELVNEHVAGVLGHASVAAADSHRPFKEAGFDSLGAIELRNALSRATGLRLPSTLVFDYPTPVAVRDYVRRELTKLQPQHAPPEHGRTGTLTALLQRAHRQGMLSDAAPVLIAASKLSPTFRRLQDLSHLPHIATLGKGPEQPELICIPSFINGLGPHQFLRIAEAFDGRRTVSVVPLPGFQGGEFVPASWDLAVDALAASVSQAAEGNPYALIGYSIGGALAYSLAERLEDESAPLAGLVLLDTYLPDGDEPTRLFASVVGQILEQSGADLVIDDDHLIAMGAYAGLLSEWVPGSVKAPSVLIKASKPLGPSGEDEQWQMADSTIEITGSHFTIIGENADATARAIETWLLKIASDTYRL